MSNALNNAASTASPLEDRASAEKLRELREQGLLSQDAYQTALGLVNPGQHWWLWANRILLFLGAALLLAGVVFFFAFNWARMSSVAKLCVVQTGMWGCAVGAVRTGLQQLTGKVLMLAACILVGVLLAVFGQAYQTGADDYRSYVLWTVLILPWVCITQFGALWIVWLALTNVAFILFWIQVVVLGPDAHIEFAVFPILGAWNATALVAYLQGVDRGWNWLDQAWIGHVLWLAVITAFTIPSMIWIIDFGSGLLSSGDWSIWLGAAGWLLTIVFGQFYFLNKRRDLFAIGVNVIAICLVLLTAIGRGLFEASNGAMSFLVFGLIVLAVSTTAAFYMRYLARTGAHESQA